jgi:hypothetical protein
LDFSINARWIKIAAAVVAVALGIAGVVIATHWPFTQDSVIEALEQTFSSTVEVKSFRVTYFAPGCVMEGVTFRRNGDRDVPAIATVERLTIQGSYVGFFSFPKRMPRVKVEGLHVFASTRSERAGKEAEAGAGGDQTKVIIGEINADGAVLEFASGDPGARPVKFEIHKLTLNGAGQGREMAFHAALRNPTPPGDIRADGRFGPLRRDDPGKTPASGAYVFDRADLGAFAAIGGTLSSTGKFGGTLEQMEVAGNTDVPNFEIDRSSGHAVHFKTEFAATVKGMDGDVELKLVKAEFGKTSLVARGNVAGKAGTAGKTVTLEGTQKTGTIQDWLWLLAKADRPAMAGAMNFRVQVQVPPGERDFIERVNLQGDFAIGSADFTTAPTQSAVDNLSKVALGEKPSEGAPAASVEETMQGHVEMKNASAIFSDLYFYVPGAKVHLHGTYGILTEKIDLHGHLRVDHKLSKGSSGLKGAFLKVAEQFFRTSKKVKNAEIVPIKIGGTFSQPSYGLDIIK